MRYPIASEQIRALDARIRKELKDQIEKHLRYEPMKISKSRIKRLKEIDSPQYRLRIGKMRVFYDIDRDTVTILAVKSKQEATEWLKDLIKQRPM